MHREAASKILSQKTSYSARRAHHTSKSAYSQAARQPAHPCLGPPQGQLGWSLGCRYMTFGPFVLHTTYTRSH